MKKILILTIMAAFVIPFAGCKKGEGDPFLSFHSRKARIAGKWTLKTFKQTDKSTQVSPSSTTTTVKDYNGTTVTKTTTSSLGGSPNVSTYSYSETYTYEKDGTFTGSEVDNGVTTTYEGTWNFTSKIGKDHKNKDQLVLYATKMTSGSSSTTFTGADIFNTLIFDIYQLKNKEIILKRKTTYSDSSGSDESEGEWTYEVGK